MGLFESLDRNEVKQTVKKQPAKKLVLKSKGNADDAADEQSVGDKIIPVINYIGDDDEV